MKNLKNLGKTLNRTEQKEIFGGLTDFKRKGDCITTQQYIVPCPTGGFDGCWVIVTDCGDGGLN